MLLIIYYKVYAEEQLLPENTAENPNAAENYKKSLIADVRDNFTGRISLLSEPEVKRVFYNVAQKNGAPDSSQIFGGTQFTTTPNGKGYYKYYKEIESNFNETLSGFNEGNNYLVLVVEDNVGNLAIDSAMVVFEDKLSEFVNYTLNVDKTPPSDITTEGVSGVLYTNAKNALKLSGTVSDKTTKIDGEGKMIFKDVGVYEGEYTDNQRDGYGVFTWDNGDVYKGVWKNDKISGKGEYSFADGSILSGTFSDNQIENGDYTIKTKDYTLVRTFTAGKLDNKVSLNLSSGESFVGTITNGEYNGTGTVKYSNGDKYTGGFVNSKRGGTGTYTWKAGARYTGSWANDKMSGDGKYYYSKEDYPMLTGTFSDGKPNGSCTYYEKADIVYYTTWSKGECTKVEEKK